MRTYRARWVLPIDAPPIEDGEVVVSGSLIEEVRTAGRGACTRDFGEAVIMPGFVDAHSHLEYTALRGFLEDVPFFQWIRTLNASKARFELDDWRSSAQLGALECLAGGITCIGDNTDAGVTMEVAAATGLRGVIYQEVFGIDHRDPVEPIVDALKAKIERHSRLASDRLVVGISPHAPYTVRPALFDALMALARERALPISIHVAESLAECRLTRDGDGPFAQMFQARGIEWDVPHVSPTRYVSDQRALTPLTLAVHCVHQSADDIELVARARASIVHCPKSNAKLGAGIAPLSAWLASPGLRVALGTDSAVSNNVLDMFEEMRFGLFAQRALHHESVGITARQMVEIATAGGARSLGFESRVGTLAAGRDADMIAVDVSGPHASPVSDPYSALVYSCRASDVRMTMIAGRVVYDEGKWKTLDAAGVSRGARAMRAKVASPEARR